VGVVVEKRSSPPAPLVTPDRADISVGEHRCRECRGTLVAWHIVLGPTTASPSRRRGSAGSPDDQRLRSKGRAFRAQTSCQYAEADRRLRNDCEGSRPSGAASCFRGRERCSEVGRRCGGQTDPRLSRLGEPSGIPVRRRDCHGAGSVATAASNASKETAASKIQAVNASPGIVVAAKVVHSWMGRR
jgi:hypothetical protein